MRAPNYLMVLPVQHFRVDRCLVAVESAFAEHLRMMRNRIGDVADRLVVASPAMGTEAYKSRQQVLSIIDEEKESISFCALFSEDATRSLSGKARHLLPIIRTINSLTQRSFCVHSGLSWNAWSPFEFLSILFGIILRRRTVFVVDIDYRNSALMSYRVGDWSWTSYALCRYIYDTARSLQLRIATRFCSLVLLKGRKMVADFGSGRPNVKYILDAAHSEQNIIDAGSLKRKMKQLGDNSLPLRLTYFGRLTPYKGIDRCLRAAAMAKQLGANVQLDIIGGGEQLDALRRLSAECGADSYVRFHGGLPFNQKFFCFLYQFHLLLAAPLREDTPRSALDAMAAGVPYLAFDTYYYRELLESGAGRTVPWLDVEAMAQALVELDRNREQVASMVQHSVAYARANTQEIWLERRLAWTLPSKKCSKLSL
jgi:glycosyltransferase involved in cell wall biosynthesis